MAIHLDHLIPGAWESWVLLFALASDIEDGWTIVGGQMVQVLAAEYGAAELVRPTEDVDVLVDVRTHRDGTERMAKWLEDYGLTLAGYSPEGIGHRYMRDTTGGVSRLIVDVLAPEGLGERANLTTTPPARTVEVPGGTQALANSEAVHVTITDVSGGARRSGTVQRPRLVPAIITKAEATGLAVRDAPDRDWQDAALLLSLIPDPFVAAEELGRKDRTRIAALTPLMEPNHVGWELLDDEAYRRGSTALGVLAGG